MKLAVQSGSRMTTYLCIVMLGICSLVGIPHPTFAQGPLTPPGPPAPTFKTLQQVEPRMPISSAPFTITASGSYYLTTNLNAAIGHGITIAANNVTVDLNGFLLTGTFGYDGIFLQNQTNVTVRGGAISGWGYGVYAGGKNVLLERLVISTCTAAGINASGSSLIRDCVCSSNPGSGISSSGGEIENCDASSNGAEGITSNGGVIDNCDASSNGGDGIYANNSNVRNCRATGNAQHGIYIAPGGVSDCLVQNNGHSGIYINLPGSRVVRNVCIGNNTSLLSSYAGIYVNDNNNRIEENHVTASGFAGISVNSVYSLNIIIKNSVSGNGGNNYLTPGAQVIGPLVTTTGTITNLNPWANFSY